MTGRDDAALTVIFDGYCGFCTRCAELGRRIDPHARVRYVAHQAPGVRERFGITRAQAEYQIWAIDPAGGVRGGAQAAAAILDAALGTAPWVRQQAGPGPTSGSEAGPGPTAGSEARRRLRGPFERLASLPGIEQGLDRAYQWVARNRGRLPGMTPWCESHPDDCRR